MIAVYLGLTLLDGEIAFFPAFFILLLAPEFYTPFRQLGAAFHTGMAGKTSILKYEDFMNREPSLPVGGDTRLDGSVEHIEIKDLTFTYKNSDNGVRHITLEAKRNEPIMLVGESGAGKSTIAHIVGGFLQAPRTTVTVDGHDICDLNIDWWRQQITYVSQHPHIMKGTLREILSFGMDVSDKEILDACKEVQLLDVINRHAEGLDAVIGEGGLGLSGGERQRVALARAFLRKGQVLILDEVTAHLDVKTESIISTAIQQLMKDKVVIIIGHRLQTMHWASKLYVLKQGVIIQQGSYEELVAVDGYFKELVASGLGQFSSVIEELKTSRHSTVQSIDVIDAAQKQECITDAKKQECITEAKKQEIITDAVTKSSTIDTHDVNRPTMGLQGWKLLFAVLSPAKWSLVLALLFTFLTVFMNVGLLTVSSWLLASAALQPGLTYLSLAIVGVRFFGVSRTGYFKTFWCWRYARSYYGGYRGITILLLAHSDSTCSSHCIDGVSCLWGIYD